MQVQAIFRIDAESQGTSSVPTLPGASSAVAISDGRDDVHGADAGRQRRERLLELGDHAALDGAVGDGGLASATVSRGRRVAGSSLSRRTPPTAVHATSAPARTARGELAGDDVGVDVEDGAGRCRRRGRRSPAAVARVRARRAARRRSRRRRRRARSRPACRRAPDTTRGGRRCARMTPLAPCSPNAGTPSAAQRRDQIDVELPGDDHLHDVERRLVGDAPAADDGRFDPEALRQRRRLRAAAVHDQQPPPGAARARSPRRRPPAPPLPARRRPA